MISTGKNFMIDLFVSTFELNLAGVVWYKKGVVDLKCTAG